MTVKLLRSEHRKIRKLYKTHNYTYDILAIKYQVDATLIGMIVRRVGNYAKRLPSPPGEKRKLIIKNNTYYVYADGRVWSKRANKFLSVKQYTDSDNYSSMRVRIGPKLYILGRLLLECFVGPPPSPAHQCCHNDGDSLNCKLSNIRWDLPKGNSDDKYVHKTHLHGEEHHSSKITNKQLKQLKKEWIKSGITLSQFSRKRGPEFGWSIMTIYYAIKYRKDYEELYELHQARLAKLIKKNN